MNADLLLAHYQQVADAPDAITRLRRFILDLAVRGKLVPQDLNDEPASELLRRIASERARLVKSIAIRDRAPLPVVLVEEEPFDVPSSWQWVRFANIVEFSAGKTPSRNDSSFWNSGEHSWVSIADMNDGQVLTATKETVSDKARERVFGSDPEPPGTIIMSFKLTIGKIARLAISAFHNEAIISIKPHLGDLDTYLFKVLPQFARQGDTKGAIKGATLNRNSISNILLPLPPLAEQHRIVAKVDELMALCDRLQSARAGREAARDRMAAATLARLNAPDPDTFQDDARFALDALPSLTRRHDQIKHLRRTILNLAVRGKLVMREPEDEPANALLSRARESKDAIRRERSIGRHEDPEFSESAGEPISPTYWAWAHLNEFALVLGGKRLPAGAAFSPTPTDYIYIRITDMKGGTISTESLKYITRDVQRQIKKYTIDSQDLYITIAGTIGEVGQVPDFFRGHNLTENAAKIVFREIDRAFLTLALQSADVQAQFTEKTKQMAQPKLALKRILGARVPVPPIAEQHRIVAKVDELMALCDRLEASLTATEETRGLLLDALLAEALSPSRSHTAA